MQVNVEEVSSLTRKMTVVLPRETVSKALDAAYGKLNNRVSIKGFRKGKVPRKVLEKNYGESIRYEVADKLVQDTYFDALEQTDIDAVVHPEISRHAFEEDGTFVYEAEVDVRPQFELGEYKGVEVEQPEIVVTDEEVESELAALQRRLAPLSPVEDRPIREGDIAVIDFQGFHEGEPMPQVQGEDYTVDVGSGQNGKEFEEKLVGLSKGDETSVEVEFPPGFANPVLAGKKVEFRLKVKDVKERLLPELNDDFAKEVGEEFENLEALKSHIREERAKRKQEAQKGDLIDRLMAKILEEHDFEVPPRLVAYEIDALIKELENNLERQGMTLESAGINRDDLVKQYQEAAEKRVRGDFIIKKIAEVEEIKLENEDIDKGFQRIADQYQMPVSEVRQFFQSRNELLPFLNELLSEKVLEFLVSQAKVKSVPQEGEDATEASGGDA